MKNGLVLAILWEMELIFLGILGCDVYVYICAGQ